MTKKGAKQPAKWKQEKIKLLVEKINKYPIIGAVNLESLPAKTLQGMRDQLRDKVELVMTKKSLLILALEKSDKDTSELVQYLRGMPALLFTNDNPFTLFKILKKNKQAAPAKAGQIAPKDILISAGPTPFAPGPIIGELGSIGLKTGVEQGKVAIKDDSVVCKEGEAISEKLAGILTRLDIKPMEIGLDLVATWENGVVFNKSVLDIDEEKYIEDLTTAASWAINLGVEAVIPSGEIIDILVSKAASESRNLAIEANILNADTVELILAKEHSIATNLKAQLGV